MAETDLAALAVSLLERIAEDERRVLAECDARRRIVQEYQRVSAALDPLTMRLRAGEPLSLEDQVLRDRLALELIGFGFAVAALAGGDGMSSH